MAAKSFPILRNPLQGVANQALGVLGRLPGFAGLRTIATVTAVLILVATIYLAQASGAAYVAHSLRVKEMQIEELEQQNSQLRAEITAATAPSAIEARARKLGLQPPTRVIYANFPALAGGPDLGVMNLPARASAVPAQDALPAQASVWDDILSLFGLGRSNRAAAEPR